MGGVDNSHYTLVIAAAQAAGLCPPGEEAAWGRRVHALTVDLHMIAQQARQDIERWLGARAVIIAELEGSDPGYLWIPTKPGRPRGGREPVKPGLTRAAVRTLHAAHRTLVSQVLGTPLRPGAFRVSGLSRSRSSQRTS